MSQVAPAPYRIAVALWFGGMAVFSLVLVPQEGAGRRGRAEHGVGRRVFSAPRDSAAMAPLSGSLKEDPNFPTSIAADARGNLLVVDQNGGGIVVLGRDGAFRGRQLSMGWKEGLLRYPSQICVGGDGSVFVADRGNNRVQAFLTAR